MRGLSVEQLSLLQRFKDPETFIHEQHVSSLVIRIAKRIGCPDEEAEQYGEDALLHDIGKLSFVDLVNRPGKLTEREMNKVRKHPKIGGLILRNYPQMQPAACYHHECFDGSGYPFGLVGYNIPEIVRIVTVADAAEAMMTRRGFPVQKVKEELAQCSGIMFDPVIAQAGSLVLDEMVGKRESFTSKYFIISGLLRENQGSR